MALMLGRHWLSVCCASTIITGVVNPAFSQLRVVNFNIASLNGDLVEMGNVLTEIQDDTRPGFSTPVSIFMCQEVGSADFAPMLSLINAAAPPGVSYSGATFTVIGNENSAAGAQAMFYRSDLLFEIVAGHADIFTGASRYTDRWQLQLLGYTNPPVAFYVYSSHLKASQGADNEATRLTGAEDIRADAATLPTGSHIIYCGDFNLYHNNEPAYLEFLSFGINQAFDPLGTGSWAGAGNAIKHTQSPCLNNCGLVPGGLDDRFDFQLSTFEFQDNDGLAIIPGTYRAFGNDGNHFNIDINDGNNTYFPGDIPRSNFLADALHAASDHIPVVVDYQLPAVAGTILSPSFGTVIQGAAVDVQFIVSNDVVVDNAIGGDDLVFSAVGSGALSGLVNGVAAPLAGFQFHDFPVDTSIVGAAGGTVVFVATSQDAQNNFAQLNTSGTVLRPANSSFSGLVDQNLTTLALKMNADTGVQLINVDVFNFGFDIDQALMDIDSVTAGAAPFAFDLGLTTGVTTGPASLTFSIDTTGLAPGLHAASFNINTSDEDLPGEGFETTVVNLDVTIGGAPPCPGDVDNTGVVDVSDLLTVLGQWGACSTPCTPGIGNPACTGDTNLDCQVDVTDLLTVLGAWGPCP